MIGLKEAIDIFHNKIKGEYIGYVYDTGNSFIMVSVDENGEELDTAATEIDKKTGNVTAYLPFDDDEDKMETAVEVNYTEIKHS